MSLADLVSAGAPGLPAGWFYRVVVDGYIGTKVELREHGRLWSTYYGHAWVREEDYDSATEAVVDACKRVVETRTRLLEQRRKAAGVAAFAGDHDPRRKK